MLYQSFKEIQALENVKSAGSDTDKNPLFDESVTLFLENGYRLISTKSLLGQTLELEPFDENVKSQPTYKAEIYHDIDILPNKPKNRIFEVKNGISKDISIDEFIMEVTPILGSDVSEFLKQRHESLPFRKIYINKL